MATTKKTKKSPRVLLDVSTFPTDEKGRAIVPDDFLDDHIKELPDGTRNESGTKYIYKGGVLKALGADPERDKEVHRAGAESLNAKLAQRKTLAQSIDDLLRKKANRADLERYNLSEGATNQDVVTAALFAQAMAGNMKAYIALRDTAGEMPVSKQQIQADIMTEADRALIEKLQKRVNENK